MKFAIPTDILRDALAAHNATRRHLDPTGEKRMRAALEAVAPRIAAAVSTMADNLRNPEQKT